MEKLLNYMEAHTASLQDLTNKIDGFEARLRRVEQDAQDSNNNRNTTTSNNGNNYTVPGVRADQEQEHPGMEDPMSGAKRKAGLDDHRTAPHKLLLLWPSVRPLLKAAHVEHNDGYVMEAEDRGVLRLWTRGEGIDENDGTQPGGPASPARSDESGEAPNAPTPHTDGLWGSGFLPLPTVKLDDRTRTRVMVA